MLAVVCAAALVLAAGTSWVLPTAAGGENLKPPEDIEVYIIDDNYTLEWSSHRESMGNVTFSAEYKTKREERATWSQVPECQHIPRTKCEFSLLNIDVYMETQFRVRAEEGNNTSPWNKSDSFIPVSKAHISPPGVRLEAEDKAILVYISPPGQDGNMWALEKSYFSYMIRIWQKSSGDKKSIKCTYYPEKILELLPETTYCLEVEAVLGKRSNCSAVQCVNTTVANKMPVPERLEVDGQGENYVLKWDYTSPNVSFRAQWLPGYLKSTSGSHSDKWKSVPTCTNVWTTHCVSPRNTFYTGTFFLRVQASDGNNTSFWSEEKFIDSQKYTLLPAPVIAVTPRRDTLLVDVSCQQSLVSKCDGLVYEIIFWENTSNAERRMVKEHPKFNIVSLQPLTVYCVQARVLCRAMWNQTSKFSNKLCKKTHPGNSSMTWLITGFCAVFFSVLALCAGRSLQKYLFFPPLKPPPSIDEFLSEPLSKNLLLLTAEEHIERCFIIEHGDVIAVEENPAPEDDLRKYSSQTSQDSGNYSIEEEESVGTESGQDALSTAP